MYWLHMRRRKDGRGGGARADGGRSRPFCRSTSLGGPFRRAKRRGRGERGAGVAGTRSQTANAGTRDLVPGTGQPTTDNRQPNTDNEQRATDNGPAVRFDFRFIPDAEIATYFAATDVVLAPYRIEAQSGVALTAFHFARPVIGTRVGGLPEIIDGTNGILVDSENPGQLAAAVDAFFTTRDRAAMEAAAAASARKYSWEEYGALFRRLVNEIA